jgi:hypothetical protein
MINIKEMVAKHVDVLEIAFVVKNQGTEENLLRKKEADKLLKSLVLMTATMISVLKP